MESSIVKRTAAAIAAAAMTCTLGVIALTPQSALAAEQSPTPLTTQAASVDDSPLATQATKKVVYLRTKAGTTKYSYNSNGLITKIKGKYETWTFKYSGTKMTSAVKKTSSDTIRLSLKYDSKGRVKSIQSKGSSSYNTYTETFKYNSKGCVTKAVRKNTGLGTTDTYKYTYNSKGLVTKSTGPAGNTTIEYDKKGNPTGTSVVPPSGSYGMSRYIIYKNTYKNGRITKIVTSMNGTSGPLTTKISYASKKLDKKYAAAAKAQQRALLVATPNSVLPLSLS